MRHGKEPLHHGLDHFFVGAARSRNGLFDFAWRKFFNRKTSETGRADCSASGVSKKQCALRVDIHEHTLAGGNCRQMCLDDRFDFAGDMRQSRCSLCGLTLRDVKDARRNPNGFGARRVNDAPAGVIETGIESENAHCGSHALPKPSVG